MPLKSALESTQKFFSLSTHTIAYGNSRKTIRNNEKLKIRQEFKLRLTVSSKLTTESSQLNPNNPSCLCIPPVFDSFLYGYKGAFSVRNHRMLYTRCARFATTNARSSYTQLWFCRNLRVTQHHRWFQRMYYNKLSRLHGVSIHVLISDF